MIVGKIHNTGIQFDEEYTIVRENEKKIVVPLVIEEEFHELHLSDEEMIEIACSALRPDNIMSASHAQIGSDGEGRLLKIQALQTINRGDDISMLVNIFGENDESIYPVTFLASRMNDTWGMYSVAFNTNGDEERATAVSLVFARDGLQSILGKVEMAQKEFPPGGPVARSVSGGNVRKMEDYR